MSFPVRNRVGCMNLENAFLPAVEKIKVRWGMGSRPPAEKATASANSRRTNFFTVLTLLQFWNMKPFIE